jgi:hypothetical protein
MLRDSRNATRGRFLWIRIGLFTMALVATASTTALADPDDTAQLLRKRYRRGAVTIMPDRRVPALGLRNTAPQGGIIPINPPHPRGGNPPHFPPQYSAADDVEHRWNPVADWSSFLRGMRARFSR